MTGARWRDCSDPLWSRFLGSGNVPGNRCCENRPGNDTGVGGDGAVRMAVGAIDGSDHDNIRNKIGSIIRCSCYSGEFVSYGL